VFRGINSKGKLWRFGVPKSSITVENGFPFLHRIQVWMHTQRRWENLILLRSEKILRKTMVATRGDPADSLSYTIARRMRTLLGQMRNGIRITFQASLMGRPPKNRRAEIAAASSNFTIADQRRRNEGRGGGFILWSWYSRK